MSKPKKINLSATRGALTQVTNIIDGYELLVEERDNLRTLSQEQEREIAQLKAELAGLRDHAVKAAGPPVVRSRTTTARSVDQAEATAEPPQKRKKVLKAVGGFFNPPVNNPPEPTTTPEVKS